MFRINAPDLDWLTLTTWNPIAFTKISQAFSETPVNPSTKEHDNRWLQYVGTLRTDALGSVFLGTAMQNGKRHYAAWASGPIAGDLLASAKPFISRDLVKCTRVDLQLTVNYNRLKHSQTEFADLLRHLSGKVVSYVESQSGPAGSKLGTIYYGSRQSDRVVRIYEKMGLGEDVYLRFEVEYKKPRSGVVLDALVKHGDPAGILLSELDRLPVPGDSPFPVYIGNLFHEPLTEVDAYPIEVVKPEPATVKWLRRQVYPAIERVLNDHDQDARQVAYELMDILRRCAPPDVGGDELA